MNTIERLKFDLTLNTREMPATVTSTPSRKVLTVRADDVEKLITFVHAYDHWLKLWTQDVREDLEDDGSLEKAVQELDEARKALDMI